MKRASSERANFNKLLTVMRRLRGKGGCPWDRQQQLSDLATYLLEETHETIEAIRERDYRRLREELGDLLYQIVFICHLAGEKGKFGIADVIAGICDKLERRHPHVFGSERVDSADEVLRNWEMIKMQEKAVKSETSLLAGVPAGLPALLKAYRLSSKAARVGFDWKDTTGVFDKLSEELEELMGALRAVAAAKGGGKKARSLSHRAAVRDELGDILFAMCNIARKLGIDPEDALQRTNAKFVRRFRHIERSLHKRGLRCTDASLDDMERLWQEAKGRNTSKSK